MTMEVGTDLPDFRQSPDEYPEVEYDLGPRVIPPGRQHYSTYNACRYVHNLVSTN